MSLKNSLEVLKELQRQLAELKTKASPIEQRIDEIRADILEMMQAEGVERITHSGLQAIEVVTKGLKVTDEVRLHTSLFEAGKFDQCVKTSTITSLMMPEVKKVVAAGFNLAGIEETVSRTLRINKVDD